MIHTLSIGDSEVSSFAEAFLYLNFPHPYVNQFSEIETRFLYKTTNSKAG